jgi:hypothetical protein
MKDSKHKKNSTSVANRPLKRTMLIGLIVLVFISVGGVLYYFSAQSGHGQPDYRKLVGNWGRPDGDYVLRISDINLDRTVQVSYFNPNPINVAQANVSSQNNTVKLFVELRDTGYPGSKYNLTYNPNKDMLEGVYFQAQAQQLYDVIFQRMK